MGIGDAAHLAANTLDQLGTARCGKSRVRSATSFARSASWVGLLGEGPDPREVSGRIT
jgi:hypothetical protein